MEDVLRSCCAGLDIHQKVIVACVIHSVEGKKRSEKFFGSFETTTRGLFDLSDWLTSYEVTHISMESTGVYRMFSDQSHYNELGEAYLQSKKNTLTNSVKMF